MFKWKKILLIVVCAGVFLFYMGYFNKPEDKVNDFVSAYNHQNVRAMIGMFDNQEVNQMKSAMSFAGKISEATLGIDASELLMDFLPISESLLGYTGSRMDAYIQSTDMDLLHSEAKVYTQISISEDEATENENIIFFLKKKDREWYITDIQEY
ncbi:hypothetical protein CHN50_07625 [Priestia aryabhattai]|nr:hypothetical protein CHN50_07625 [Priestia aryabhattai]